LIHGSDTRPLAVVAGASAGIGTLVALKHDAVQAPPASRNYQEVVVNWSGLPYHPENITLTYEIANADVHDIAIVEERDDKARARSG
jgi:hypothetical protein